MKIKSRFKDYYDFVAHQYGGGDPKVPYLRDRIMPLNNTGYSLFESYVKFNLPNMPRLFKLDFSREKVKTEFKWLAVCGKAYLLIGYTPPIGFTEFHIINTKDDVEVIEKLTKYQKYAWQNSIKRELSDYLGTKSDILVDISMKIDQPVYIIGDIYNNHDVVIESRIPVLEELGFASIIKPELLYQEIAYYISNVMVESADIKPPTIVSNKDRIQQYGFDLKQSFRHRK